MTNDRANELRAMGAKEARELGREKPDELEEYKYSGDLRREKDELPTQTLNEQERAAWWQGHREEADAVARVWRIHRERKWRSVVANLLPEQSPSPRQIHRPSDLDLAEFLDELKEDLDRLPRREVDELYPHLVTWLREELADLARRRHPWQDLCDVLEAGDHEPHRPLLDKVGLIIYRQAQHIAGAGPAVWWLPIADKIVAKQAEVNEGFAARLAIGRVPSSPISPGYLADAHHQGVLSLLHVFQLIEGCALTHLADAWKNARGAIAGAYDGPARIERSERLDREVLGNLPAAVLREMGRS